MKKSVQYYLNEVGQQRSLDSRLRAMDQAS